MIRTYNNHFAFTFIGMHCDETLQKRDHGIYNVRVQGKVHHYLDDLIPHGDSKKLSGIQFYFYDSKHQATNRLSAVPRSVPGLDHRTFNKPTSSEVAGIWTESANGNQAKIKLMMISDDEKPEYHVSTAKEESEA
ncbi:hypothetical protein LIER_13162 [Lithospermum erythrorhizon]|uniref:Uncharacterized protein n=1 Tax=Lithospermum erythrorhizon TaxID=34254 RepID=A0AAV3PWY8_LITER